nr:hypothetical protein [Pseudomonadota bacterium]
MAKPLAIKEIVTTEEIVITNMVEISALIELLMEKGIITEDELIKRYKKLRGRSGGVSCLFETPFVSFGKSQNFLIQLAGVADLCAVCVIRVRNR